MYSGGAHFTIPFTERTLTMVPDFALAGGPWAVVLTHTGFAMPFAIFLLHNYMSSLPGELIESARVDGADHFSTFVRLVCHCRCQRSPPSRSSSSSGPGTTT